MATRYWVGGSGTWDASTTTNWSTSSGGAGGASAPTSSDDVVFNLSSGTVLNTVNAVSGAVCANMTYSSGALVLLSGFASVYGAFVMDASGSSALSAFQVVLFGNSLRGAANSYIQSVQFNNTGTTTFTGSLFVKYFYAPSTAVVDLAGYPVYTNWTQIDGSVSNGDIYFSALDSVYKQLNIAGSWSTATVYVGSSTYQPFISISTVSPANTGDIVFNYSGTSTIDALKAKNITINAGTLTNTSYIIYAYGNFYLSNSATLSVTSSSTVNIVKVVGSPTATRTLRVEGTLSTTGRITFNINAGADTVNVTGSNFGSNTYTANTITVQSPANFSCSNVYAKSFSVYPSVACDISALTAIYTSTFSNSSVSLVPGSCTLNFKNYAGFNTGFFTAGVVTYNAVTVVDAIPLQFTGAATINTLTCASSLGQGSTMGLQFDGGYTYTINTNFTLSGASSSDRVSLTVKSGTTPATLSKASGTVTAAYATISYSTATGGATFKAPLTTNINGGNNTGWIFNIPGGGNFFPFF